MAKGATQKKSSNQPANVKVSRPRIAPVYGVPKHNKNLLDWSHVQERMTNAKVYWVCTVSPDGKPHARPVDGMWVDDKFYFGGDPSTNRNRNLDANPAVSVHLEEGYNVLIIEGDALPLRTPDRELAVQLAEASNKKYGYGMTPENYTGAGTYVLRPRVVFAWTNFGVDPTRWEFNGDS